MIYKFFLITLILFSISAKAIVNNSIGENAFFIGDNNVKVLKGERQIERVEMKYIIRLYKRLPGRKDSHEKISGVFNVDSEEIKELSNKTKYVEITSGNVSDDYVMGYFNDERLIFKNYEDYSSSENYIVGIRNVGKLTYDISVQEFNFEKGPHQKMKWIYGLLNRVSIKKHQVFRLEVMRENNDSHVYIVSLDY